ncbi:MAG TPA: glycosyltransferase family 2 protein [Nitrososphaerales archaeon]|nr:glycosyltransferase family 2 protein [Nitrososphaerales archaeon]
MSPGFPLPLSPSSPLIGMSAVDRLVHRKSHMTVDPNYVNYTFAIVIPAYNEERMISQTIRSCLKQSKMPARIFVVDDISTDGTAEIVRRYSAVFPNVILVKNDVKRGKAGGINYVLRHVTEDIVMVIDADTYLHEKYCENMIRALRFYGAAAATGYVIPYTERGNSSPFMLHRAYAYIYGHEIEKRAQESINGMIVLAGCAAAYKREILVELGGMPLDTIVEDMDLTWRLIERGYKTIYTKNAFAFTDEPENFKAYRTQLDRWYGGFFECLHAHGQKIFRSRALTFTVVFGIMQGLWTPFFIGYLAYSVYNGDLLTGTLLILLNFAMQFAITAFKAWRTKRFKTILKGTMVTLILSMVDTLIWNKCLLKYGVLGKRVKKWSMGVQRAH